VTADLSPAVLAELAALETAATPGPWASLTHGTASQRDAAGRAYEAVMARRLPGSPDIEFTDLSWIETTPDGPHIGLTGNGPDAPENAKFIAAIRNAAPALLAALAAAEARVENADPLPDTEAGREVVRVLHAEAKPAEPE
jgi:hypothetical protein